MSVRPSTPAERHLIWIYPDNLLKKLNAAPTLQTTRGLRQAGWQVDLLMGGVDGTTKIQGVEVTGIPRPDRFVIKQFIYHYRAIKFVLGRWNTTDIIYFLSISTPWMLLLRIIGILKRGKRPLFVMDTRTMQMEKKTFRDKLHGHYTDFMSMLSNRFTDGQTAITRRMADVYHIPAAKLWGTWSSGVNLEEFCSAVKDRRWPLDNEPVQIVYVGTLAPGRGLLSLCHAVEKANQEGTCFELSLVGDGADRERLLAYAAGSQGRIRLLGRLPHEQVPGFLRGMHVGALPFPDGVEFQVSSPIKLFEYLGAGIPVLATRIACHTDVIGDRSCVFWVEDSTVDGLTEALRDLWENRYGLPNMGHVAIELAQEYSWAASTRKLVAAFEHGLTMQQEKAA